MEQDRPAVELSPEHRASLWRTRPPLMPGTLSSYAPAVLCFILALPWAFLPQETLKNVGAVGGFLLLLAIEGYKRLSFTSDWNALSRQLGHPVPKPHIRADISLFGENIGTDYGQIVQTGSGHRFEGVSTCFDIADVEIQPSREGQILLMAKHLDFEWEVKLTSLHNRE